MTGSSGYGGSALVKSLAAYFDLTGKPNPAYDAGALGLHCHALPSLVSLVQLHR